VVGSIKTRGVGVKRSERGGGRWGGSVGRGMGIGMRAKLTVGVEDEKANVPRGFLGNAVMVRCFNEKSRRGVR